MLLLHQFAEITEVYPTVVYNSKQCCNHYRSLAIIHNLSSLHLHFYTFRNAAAVNSSQEAQLSPRDHAMRRVSRNLASCHATVQKLLARQVLNQVSAVAN